MFIISNKIKAMINDFQSE